MSPTTCPEMPRGCADSRCVGEVEARSAVKRIAGAIVRMSPVGTKRTSQWRLLMSALWGWSQPVDATLYLKGEMECALMGRRFHRGFTAAEKAELWDRWKRGESLKAIGRAFGKPSSSIHFFGGSAWWDSSCPAAPLQ